MSRYLFFLSRPLFYFPIAAFLIVSLSALAQDDDAPARRGSKIIDDSTKNVYGPNTSHYFYENDFFSNRLKLHAIDTTAHNFHRFSYIQRYNNFYQDLGNIGTAIKPIYTPVPETIGVSPGFDAYDLYWNSEAIRYYDTKSPYSNMKVILGGKGRSVTRITFSRNITPRWNVGFNYRVLLIDKQVARSGKGDRNVKSNYYDLYSVYQTKDSAYCLFVNYKGNFLQADEYGGVKLSGDYSPGKLFLGTPTRPLTPSLLNAESNDKRGNLHLFQQYKLGSGLQLYHKSDLFKQRNRFNDAKTENDFYDFIVIDSAKTRDQVEFKTFRNEVGVKGNLLKLFYNGYAAFRKYSMEYKYFYEDDFYLTTSATELYVGGRMALQVDSLIEVKGWAEWLLDDRYQIKASIRTKWFQAEAKRSVSSPTFLQQAYRGSHDVWLNDFTRVEGTEIKGSLIYQSNRISVYPGIRFSTFRNYIFFKTNDQPTGQQVLPIQSRGYQTWVSPELNFSVILLKNITLNSQALYTKILENADEAIQAPEMFINSQLSYSNIWFKGNFDFQVGADVHWKSEYYAPAYDPVIQQFYIQKEFLAPSFPIVDIFLNARIKHARIFLKYNNLVKAFSNYANVPTPFYPGINNIIDFGFDWSFYD